MRIAETADEAETVEMPRIKFPVVTVLRAYANNDTRLGPAVNSSLLQNIAFSSLQPNGSLFYIFHTVASGVYWPDCAMQLQLCRKGFFLATHYECRILCRIN